ncbi:alpha/beta hydrolase [Paraburkholderia dipogonis]|uniref:Alpha/beta hydrolase n=1 Tax=Paraburkholderia dipogonis TaxID=1211383 RepID=A0A4Y8N4C3_9BURK|nr:alpha/beta hydrolase [Paraburkholderia dipogonis]TFE44660.1 alpha/beta hydrolase [Paraburkholderia dipogonis]
MNKTMPLVMIHGLFGSQSFYAPNRRIADVDVHTPDLLGYGMLGSTAVEPITLTRQAEHVIRYVRERAGAPCVLLGHSVGGAIAMLAAASAPELVCGVINVEGNFTLEDAFWCRKIANLDAAAWRAEHARLVADPQGWLTNGGIAVTPQRLEWARAVLENQPHQTIQAMALAVVRETGAPGFRSSVRTVVEHGTPLFMLAGERSASGWHAPDWAYAAARSYVIQPEVGHMMMLEEPDEFCRIIAAMVAQIAACPHGGSVSSTAAKSGFMEMKV